MKHKNGGTATRAVALEKGLCLQRHYSCSTEGTRLLEYELLSLQVQIGVEFFERALPLIIVELSIRTSFWYLPLIINPVLSLLRQEENKCNSCMT